MVQLCLKLAHCKIKVVFGPSYCTIKVVLSQLTAV